MGEKGRPAAFQHCEPLVRGQKARDGPADLYAGKQARLNWVTSRGLAAVISLSLLAGAISCSGKIGAEPKVIEILPILISFKDALIYQGPGGVTPTPIVKGRTEEEAQELAEEILAKGKEGVGFFALMKKYSDDPRQKIYKVANHGKRPPPGYFPRSQLDSALGNVGFALRRGEVGIAEYHTHRSPCGWLVIKRFK